MQNQGPGKWLSLTRSEYAGAFFMLIISIFLAFIPSLLSSNGSDGKTIFRTDSAQRASLIARHLAATDSFFHKKRNQKIPWYILKPGDFESMGLNEEESRRLHEKIKLGYKYKSISELSAETGIDSSKLKLFIAEKSFNNRAKNKTDNSIIDLNICDTAALIALPGIGSKTALKIIRFRDALGGFYKPEQVLETRYTDTIVLKSLMYRFKADGKNIRKIAINKADIETLKKHPYISERQAKIIVNFRQQHGKLSETKLKEIRIISVSDLAIMLPYLDFNE